MKNINYIKNSKFKIRNKKKHTIYNELQMYYKRKIQLDNDNNLKIRNNLIYTYKKTKEKSVYE